jgi:hypothetical protein
MRLNGNWKTYKVTPVLESSKLKIRVHLSGYIKHLPNGISEKINPKILAKFVKIQGGNRKRGVLLFAERLSGLYN